MKWYTGHGKDQPTETTLTALMAVSEFSQQSGLGPTKL